MIRIAIISPRSGMTRGLEAALSESGYAVSRLDESSSHLAGGLADLVIIDAHAETSRGVEVCRGLRDGAATHEMPLILITSAMADVEARVAGLEAGADDVVSWAVSSRELVARIGAVARRTLQHRMEDRRYRDAVLEVDGVRMSVSWRGVERSVSASEFELIWALLSRAPSIVSPDALARAVSVVEPMADASRARQIVQALHRKIDRDFIEIYRGWGYRYVPVRHEELRIS